MRECVRACVSACLRACEPPLSKYGIERWLCDLPLNITFVIVVFECLMSSVKRNKCDVDVVVELVLLII